MSIVSHLHHLFNSETCQSYIHMLRWKDRPLQPIFPSNPKSQKVNLRLTHPKKSAVAHRVIIALGVIGEEAPATLDAGSDPVG
jgi:hypothetical protein